MRVKMSEECENIINTCNNIKDIYEKAKESSQLKNELLESLQPTIELLSSIFERQSLKEEKFKTFEAATKQDIENFWEYVLMVDNTLNIEDNSYKKVINKVRNIKKKLIYLSLKISFQEFFTHCCKKRTFFLKLKNVVILTVKYVVQ